MDQRRPAPEVELLSEQDAARVLARASELDATHGSIDRVADLRAAAVEAGISSGAFDAALGELRAERRPVAPVLHGRAPRALRRWLVTTAGAVVLVAGLLLARMSPAPARPPMLEEAILLRCLPTADALALIRPVLARAPDTRVHTTAQAPRVLTIRAAPEQIREVRALLDRHEEPGSPACMRAAPQ